MRFVLVAALLAATSPASSQVVATHQPAALDALLAAGDYAALATTIRSRTTPDDLGADLDWLRAKMLAGESAFVSMLYARMLWDSSATLPPPRQRAVRTNAAFAILYAHAAITIDGTRCGDPSAPGHKEAQLGMMIPELLPFLATLTKAERQSLAETVWKVERDTAARRDRQGDVKFLCSGGMDEMAHNLDHGTSRELPEKPGGWRHVEVTADGTYRPRERPEAEWKALAARHRAELPRTMAEMVEALSRPTAE